MAPLQIISIAMIYSQFSKKYLQRFLGAPYFHVYGY